MDANTPPQNHSESIKILANDDVVPKITVTSPRSTQLFPDGPESPKDRSLLFPSSVHSREQAESHVDGDHLSTFKFPAVSMKKALKPNKYIPTRPIDVSYQSKRAFPVLTGVSSSSTGSENVEEPEIPKQVSSAEDLAVKSEPDSGIEIEFHTIGKESHITISSTKALLENNEAEEAEEENGRIEIGSQPSNDPPPILKLQNPLVRIANDDSVAPSKIPKLIKVLPQTTTPPSPLPPVEDALSNPRWSVITSTSGASVAPSVTRSFTTGCSSLATDISYQSVDSIDSSSTVRQRCDSTSSGSTIKPAFSSKWSDKDPRVPVDDILPPGAEFLSKDEYRDYYYVVYLDKKTKAGGQ